MKNYAEELAYWYFRFNGFFPITNYVTHPEERTNEEGFSDTDIIAIKPSGVHEEVGLRGQVDYCDFLWEKIIEPNEGKTIAIICEVKAGNNPVEQVNDKNVRAQIDRLGKRFILNEDEDEEEREVVLNLIKQRGIDEPRGLIYSDDSIVIYRFICRRDENHYMENDHSWEILTINRIVNFMISNRFEENTIKARGWHQYDSSLIQFLLRHPNLLVHP